MDKATGKAIYGVDIKLPNMLFGVALRSPVAHANIVAIDTLEARNTPGVKAVITGKDFPFTFGPIIKDQPFLAIDKVRYFGEPVAAVAAETEATAQEARDKIIVQYEELPAVFDPCEAITNTAPLIHENLDGYYRSSRCKIIPGTNICNVSTYSIGDVELGFAEADEIFKNEFYVHPVAHTPMETHAAVAQYDPSKEEYTIWSSTDAPYRRAKELADALGISFNQIRFISTYSGGGFGGKGALVAEVIAIALSRFTQGRPVKIIFSRQEELVASQTRLGAYLKLKTGVKRNGILIAREAEIIWDNGAYSSKGPGVARRGALTIFGPYRIPNLKLLSRLVYTNKQISGAYRGFGTTQVTWACEVQMDIIAKKIGLDPLDIRLKNCYVNGDCYINGQVMYAEGLRKTIEKASEEIKWKKPRLRSKIKVRGKGIATMLKGTNTPTESYCFIKVNQDGSVTVLASSVEIGAGQKTVLAQIAADTIGVPLTSILVPNPDTYFTPYDFGVTSSRTTFHMGNAVRHAGHKLRKKILKVAGSFLKTDPANLSISEGKIFEQSGRDRITLKELMREKFEGKDVFLQAEGYYTPVGSHLLNAKSGLEGMSSIFWMYATHAAEVEVDTKTGVVKVLKIAAAHDVGRAINPIGCEQQIEGAVIMGLSNVLFEEFKMEKGRVMNDTLADYKIASIMDLPEIIPIIVESQHPEGPFGAKGMGEPASAPTAPAIANAIFDAVGIRITELPITPEKVLSALNVDFNRK